MDPKKAKKINQRIRRRMIENNGDDIEAMVDHMKRGAQEAASHAEEKLAAEGWSTEEVSCYISEILLNAVERQFSNAIFNASPYTSEECYWSVVRESRQLLARFVSGGSAEELEYLKDGD